MNLSEKLLSVLGFENESHVLGGARWWEAVRLLGAPIMRSEGNGFCLVTFIWQDPQGNEERSQTKSVLLDVNSITDHHTWSPMCLSRVEGTDVWFGQLKVADQWRGSYSFIPIQADQSPDLVRRNSGGSGKAQRAWWVSIAVNQISDKLNTSEPIASGWGLSSPLHLPNAPKEHGWQEWDQGFLPLLTASHIQSIQWSSLLLENQRNCSVFSTATEVDAPLVVLLDGQKWGAASGTLSVLQYLTDQQHIAPAHYLLIPSIDGRTRWQELGCSYLFWQAFLDELLPSVKQNLAAKNAAISEVIIAGQSLGGLSAVYAALTFPDDFSKVISLSGSFWWPEENRVDGSASELSLQEQLPKGGLAEQVRDGELSVQYLSAFLTAGSGEKDICLYNQMMYEALKQKRGNVHFETVYGGHDWLSWRSSLVNGLLHFIST